MTEKQALAKIASYCSRAERCEYDVRKKLLAWELDVEATQRILTFLRKENYLNEERFCRSFVNDKMKFNRWGINKIAFELRKKHIPEHIIRDSLQELKPSELEENLMSILHTKEKTIRYKDEYEKRMKLLRFAAGRGFNADMINKCLDKLLKPDP